MSELAAWNKYSSFAPQQRSKKPLDLRSRQILQAELPLLKSRAFELGFGIEVTNLEHRSHPDGSVFAPGALFRAPNQILLANESFCLLVHELAHGVDFAWQWAEDPGEREAVAIGVEFLITSSLIGPVKASFDYEYAVRQGVTKAKIAQNKQRIFAICESIKRPV